uniref:Uncharacterized protein n=1 Tax=Plectus sambesii TaxID=2011161 RepID=A0A914X0M2_9BILA
MVSSEINCAKSSAVSRTAAVGTSRRTDSLSRRSSPIRLLRRPGRVAHPNLTPKSSTPNHTRSPIVDRWLLYGALAGAAMSCKQSVGSTNYLRTSRERSRPQFPPYFAP